jgi:ubiquinone/menaquinone biosynthesis C-methylase UbiE
MRRDNEWLEFTDEAAKQLEKAYLTTDVVAQRLETIRHLNLSTGESVLDVGCGPGFLCESMAEIVGPNGVVVGIDISADLIARCNRRKLSTWLSYEIGDAVRLKQPDSSFDVGVCTQVAEYVTDVDRVLSEVFRVLKPNGRTVFVATDWDALVWFSDNPKRICSFEIVGSALRSPASSEIYGIQISKRRFSIGWRGGPSDPKPAIY